MRKDQEVADEAAKTHPIQVEDFKHGDCLLSLRPELGITIFGEVATYSEKYPEDNESITDGMTQGYLYGRCFSQLCPDGELGSIHITRVSAKISREDFERAKANRWRNPARSN